MPPDDGPDGPEALRGIVTVSRETADRLSTLVALVRRWQRAENLVAPSTLAGIWRRHVADSAQVVPLFPNARTWVDLGSGAGFPGLVIAALVAGVPGAEVHLVESNQRKCAFLRRAAAQMKVPATIHNDRIETALARWTAPVDVVVARALAPLADLLALAEPLLAGGTRAAFPKGRDFRREIDDASHAWTFDLVEHASRIDPESVILEVAHPHRR